ncbi:hypothetical protein K435DRAFT_846269 [Dendrothele bispora CBS 962.96]|uniref:DUF6533 domain-containing protein n=1 Tax=Dendrothele bispora (strain CBS 962.96) TaxID=1314807 RepID=A0A4S8KNW5_DENBC|nr:hypothetical protein K435DRAFT_846269 [Dendrothele bispora CBS 962.96]
MDMSTLFTIVSDLQTITCIKVASLAVLVFDTVITLDQEYQYIWQRHWNAVKVLYLFIRYTTYVDTVLVVYERLNSEIGCSQISTFTTIFSGFGIALTELVLMIRTYGMYNSSRKVLIFFILLWLTSGGVNFWAITKWSASFKFDNFNFDKLSPAVVSPDLVESLQCYFGSTSLVSLVCYLTLLVGESAIVLMTAIKSVHMWNAARRKDLTKMHLVDWFYKEGTILYIFMLPITVFNVVALFFMPIALRFLADRPMRVMHTLLACRLVLHVRKVADKEAQGRPLTSFMDFHENTKKLKNWGRIEHTSRAQEGLEVV